METVLYFLLELGFFLILLTSSEVELMETLAPYNGSRVAASDFLGS